MKAMILSLVLLVFYTDCPALELGRLFMTPEQRMALQQLPKSVSQPSNPVHNDTLYLNGFVHKKNGRNTVWINSQSQGLPANVRVWRPVMSSHKVPVHVSDKTFLLKPGQSLTMQSLTINDVLQNKNHEEPITETLPPTATNLARTKKAR